MHSFISSFKRTGRRAEAARGLWVFGVAWVLLLTLGALAWRRVPEAFRRSWVPESYEPIDRSGEYYLGLYRSDAVEHHVHYQGIDPAVERAMRGADILFVGTSRMMLGLDAGQAAEFFGALGLKPYHLGFAFGETVTFTEAVMRRADLRPRWVVANVDGFFYGHPSRYGWEVLHSSVVNAFQVRFETETTLVAISALHRCLPYVSVDRAKSVWMRSRVDGHWQPYFVPRAGWGFEPTARSPVILDPGVVRVAEAFRDECARRGAKLILTFVPSPAGRRESAEELARVLQVPFAAPVSSRMETYDGSHLTPESASRFTSALLAGLAPLLDGPQRESGIGTGNAGEAGTDGGRAR